MYEISSIQKSIRTASRCFIAYRVVVVGVEMECDCLMGTVFFGGQDENGLNIDAGAIEF